MSGLDPPRNGGAPIGESWRSRGMATGYFDGRRIGNDRIGLVMQSYFSKKVFKEENEKW
jgi:hypothetical protein